jgi:hypothetical protein
MVKYAFQFSKWEDFISLAKACEECGASLDFDLGYEDYTANFTSNCTLDELQKIFYSVKQSYVSAQTLKTIKDYKRKYEDYDV